MQTAKRTKTLSLRLAGTFLKTRVFSKFYSIGFSLILTPPTPFNEFLFQVYEKINKCNNTDSQPISFCFQAFTSWLNGKLYKRWCRLLPCLKYYMILYKSIFILIKYTMNSFSDCVFSYIKSWTLLQHILDNTNTNDMNNTILISTFRISHNTVVQCLH